MTVLLLFLLSCSPGGSPVMSTRSEVEEEPVVWVPHVNGMKEETSGGNIVISHAFHTLARGRGTPHLQNWQIC
jgi:hypothetical protein